jgi:hypothetical protein
VEGGGIASCSRSFSENTEGVRGARDNVPVLRGVPFMGLAGDENMLRGGGV